MEWRSHLQRSQSLKAMTCDKSIWSEAGLRDKRTSVSQLVARYQVETRQQIQTTSRINPEVKQKEEIQVSKPLQHITSDSKNDPERFKESVMWKDEVWKESQTRSTLTRSKSLGSLHSGPSSIDALKAKFESKAAAPKEEARVMPTTRKPDIIMHLSNKENNKDAAVGQKGWAEAPVNEMTTYAKQLTAKVDNHTRIQRRKTIGGIDFEALAATQAEEKRRSIADFRDSSEKVCVSVKAISALYLSKAAPQDPNKTLVQSSEVRKRTKLTRFQPASQEMCSACFQTVYPMEKVTTDKYIFHKTCFCCKQCNKKLSMFNYAPLHGELYCIFHYQQLFRTKGNYDEGFGFSQHKSRWSVRSSAAGGAPVTEA